MNVILSGGPRHGAVVDVDRPTPVIRCVVPEPIDVTPFGSVERQTVPSLSFRCGEYRPRGHYGCGNWVCDAGGAVIYDYAGVI